MKALFVVTAFYPEQAIGAVRISKFVKHLERQGVEVSVISLAPAQWASRDEGLYFDALDRIDWVTIDQSDFFRKFFLGARSAVVGNEPAVGFIGGSGGRKTIGSTIKSWVQTLYTLLKAIDWMQQVKKHARKNMRESRYSVIFSSYPSFSSPFSAFALRRLGLSSNVIIDFRDPVSYGAGGGFSFLRLLERWMYRNSDFACFVSEGVRRKVSGRGLSDSKSAVITNGFDSDDLAKVNEHSCIDVDTQVLKFIYVGSLYGGKRDLRSFFKAAKIALERRGLAQDFIQLHYAGGEGALFQSQAKEIGLEQCVVNHGRVTRERSLELQKYADIGVVVTWNSAKDEGILTGKVFESFMLRKPVLAVVNGDVAGSELGEIIREVSAGFCYEEASPEKFQELVSWIESVLVQKIEKGGLLDAYSDSVKRFDFYALAARLKEAMLFLESR